MNRIPYKKNTQRIENKQNKYADNSDVGRVSLWLVDPDYPSRTCVATGIVNLELDGKEYEFRCFMHECSSENPKAPQYVMYIKEPKDMKSQVKEVQKKDAFKSGSKPRLEQKPKPLFADKPAPVVEREEFIEEDHYDDEDIETIDNAPF
jgi:hypothetical protein